MRKFGKDYRGKVLLFLDKTHQSNVLVDIQISEISNLL